MGKRMFSARHLTITAVLAVAGLTGVVAGSEATLETAPESWTMPALELGMHAEYAYTAFRTADGESTQLGPTRTLFTLDVMKPSLMLDASGQSHVADGYKTTFWGYNRLGGEGEWSPMFAHVGWFDQRKLVALDTNFVMGDLHPTNYSQLAGLMQTHTTTTADAGARAYLDPLENVWRGLLMPCGTNLPYQGKTVRLQDIPGDVCQVLNLPLDPAAMRLAKEDVNNSTWAFATPMDIAVMGVVDNGATLVLQHEMSRATFTMWLPMDKPFASRMVWSAYGIDHVISLAKFTSGAAQGADLPAKGDVPLPTILPLVHGLPDDRDSEHPFPASEAWKAALRHERVADFMTRHADARIYRLDYSPAYAWQGQAWHISLAGNGEELGVRVALEEDNPYALVWPELRYAVSFANTFDPPQAPLDSYPATAPAVADMIATTQAMALEAADWGWRYEVQCAGAAGECAPLVGHATIVLVDQQSSTAVDPAGPGLVTTGTFDLVEVTFAPDGKLDGSAFVGVQGTSRSTLAATGPPPSTPAAQAPTPPDPTLPNLAFAAGSISLLAALAYFLWPLAKNGAVGLFSRVQPNKALDHPTRARIAELIGAQPGIHGHDIARTTGLHRSTVDHHVRKLVESGHVTKHRAGGYTCFFPRGTDRRLHAAAPALKSETARKIFAHLQASPGATAGEVAQALGISRSTVAHHIRRMEDAGVLQGDRRGASIALSVRDVPVAA